jgi:protein-tyrosine sulfotransferase
VISSGPIAELFSRARNLLLGPTYPAHRLEDYRSFFIVGAARSGTTLLRRILTANPDIHIPPENYALPHVIQAYRRNCSLPWKDLVRLCLSYLEFQKDFETYQINMRPLMYELIEVPPAERSLACILDRFYRYHGRQQGEPFLIWGDKTPSNVYYLERILVPFPQARILNLVRDGVDVVYSMLESGLAPDLQGAAQRWYKAIESAKQFERRHPGNLINVRYEQLVSEPEETIRGVCQFLNTQYEETQVDKRDHVHTLADIDMYDHLQNVKKPINRRSIGKGRSAFCDGELMRLAELLDTSLIECGYAPATEVCIRAENREPVCAGA